MPFEYDAHDRPRFQHGMLRSSTTIRPILLLALGVTMFGVMDGLGKVLTSEYSLAQIVWGRYAFALPVVLSMRRPGAWLGFLKSRSPGLQAGRGLLPLLASMAVILGLGTLPLADFTAVSFASPLLVVALSAPLLKERISLNSWIGVVCGFIGVLVIVRPGIGALGWAAIFPLGTALFFALYQLLTRMVSREDDPWVTLAWTIAVGLVLSSLVLPFDWHAVDRADWVLLMLSGVLFGLGQFLLIQAYSMAPAAVLAPFTYVQILAAMLFGVLVFHALPDLWTLLGTGLVILAGLYVLRPETARA